MNMSIPGLQRRAGRRKSTPASPSPSSPTFHRKYGRSQDATVFSPTEPTSAYTSADSPSIDLDVPSPTFDLASISPALAPEGNAPLRPQPTNRASDDFGKTRPKFLAENLRPATSSAGGISHAIQNTFTYSPDLGGPRDSPLSGTQMLSGDGPRGQPSREQDDGSVQRSAAFWAQYGSAEDATASKTLVSNKKSRFNLLNPMSLLARRRSSQTVNKLDETNLNVNTFHVPDIPDNITPSIRGTIVHDFSAPRTRRLNNENSLRPGPAPSPQYPRRPSELTNLPVESTTATPSSLHSPMFKEHFQEEQRSVQPTNTAYLHGLNLQAPTGAALPTFAKKLPLNLPDEGHTATESFTDPPPIIRSIEHEQLLPPEPDWPPPLPPPKTPPPVLEVPLASAVPRHMTSTSSRFSFIGQQGSIAQEKFLEDKHKEHASKDPAPACPSVTSVDDVDDYDDFDGFDDDGFDNDGIPIKDIDAPSSQMPVCQRPSTKVSDDYAIDDDDGDDGEDDFGTGDLVIRNIDMPTSRVDHEREEENGKLGPDSAIRRDIDASTHQHIGGEEIHRNVYRQSLQAFHFTPQPLAFSPSTAQYTSQVTPRDVEGFPIGMAQSKELSAQSRGRDSGDRSSDDMVYDGLGISTAQFDLINIDRPPLNHQPFDDDLYFDDGEFDDNIAGSSATFDEEALDDATQIRDIPAENARKYEAILKQSAPGAEIKAIAPATLHEHNSDIPQPVFEGAESSQSNINQLPSQTGLTENNLAAHHDALAMALNRAASKANIDRTVSFTETPDDEADSPFHNSIPGVSSTDSRYSNNLVSSGISDDDEYGFDDDTNDDAMIAAANAEALENDDDGFYGQEFGFYARAHDRDSAEFTNGGYFTSRGSNGVKRSHSGKNNFQEPSLTPITERSEWSTRNSVVSLPLHTGVLGMGQSLPSPGIAQLLERDSPLAEDEMSLSALMKLRGRAFGGSSTSINSLVDRHHAHSSPLAHMSGHNGFPSDGHIGGMSSPGPMSVTGIAESEDEDDEGGRWTLTQTTPHKMHAEPAHEVSQSSHEQEPVASSNMSRKSNHSRNSSGAESVSYARDNDGRWVLERRRTGDDGELELIGREYLAGAHI